MRANRLLGANLVERGLVSIDDLDAANERFLELLSSTTGDLRLSLLAILINEKQSLSQNRLMEHLVEDEGLGIIDIRKIDIPEDLCKSTALADCWATWTVPFDLVEKTPYVATAYFLSPVVRSFWEEKFSGEVVWFAAPLETISDYLEIRESEQAKAALAAN